MIVSWLAVAQMDKLLFGIDYFLHIYIKYIFNQKNIIKLLKKIIKILLIYFFDNFYIFIQFNSILFLFYL